MFPSMKTEWKKVVKDLVFHDELDNGGKLVLIMGDKPNKKWGSRPEDAPPSMSDADN